MSATPRLIGTLIVVVLKAKNLPNKRHIGKQDPYCTLKLSNDTKRTKAVKRGGQHPEWDEEIRFELYEDVEDELVRTSRRSPSASPPAPPPKEIDRKDRKVKGGKIMRLLCYADDPREPELIGETQVDLSEALSKGETDEWFTLMNKDKYSGEVYLELTFWSNDKPPDKKAAGRPSSLHPQYGGPGSFTPSSTDSAGGRSARPSTSAGASPVGTGRQPLHDRQGSTPVEPARSSVSTSSSLANLNLYIPPYERDVSNKPDPLAEYNSTLARRRDSFPPLSLRPTTAYGFQPVASNPYATPTSVVDNLAALSLHDPYANASPSYYQGQSQFAPSLYQGPSGYAPQPAPTPVPSGFQQVYAPYNPPRPAATPLPYAVPPSSMGFHPYPQQTPQPPPFQHQSNSYPLPNTHVTPGLQAFQPPIPPVSAPPFGLGPQYSTIQGRPLPEQPQSSGFVPINTQPQYQTGPVSFPIANPYSTGATPTSATNNIASGFVAPPPPPPINQSAIHRTTSLPPVVPPAAAAPPKMNNNPPLPIPPQQPIYQNVPPKVSSHSQTGSSGPLPPLPQPPQNSAFPGPPPQLPHQQGQQINNNQPPNSQYRQPAQPNSGLAPWQLNQPSGPFTGQTPVPQPGAYPPPPQVQNGWY